MKPGSIVTLPNDVIAIVGHYIPSEAHHGIRIVSPSGTFMMHEELSEVTNITPSITNQLVAMLPKALWSVVNKEFGLSGTDPEIFGFDSTGNVIPAWTWLQNKTKNPNYYYDGVQAELVTAPTTCHNYQTDHVRSRLLNIDCALKAHDPMAYLATQDVVKLPRKTLLTADDCHIELGCSPSQNAYEAVKPIDIGDPRSHPFRYSGCHLHMSVLDYPIPAWFPHGTVAMMDKIVGIMLTALGRDMEDPERRKAYGRAGEFRVPAPAPANRPSWGGYYLDKVWTRLEYRTPGSFLLHHPALFNFALDVARAAFRMGLIMDGRKLDEIGDVQGIINNCDADAANKLIQAPGSYWCKVLDGNLGPAYAAGSHTLATLKSGAKASGRFGDTVYNNWCLGKEWNSDNYMNGPTKWSTI